MFEQAKKQFPATLIIILILIVGNRYLFMDTMNTYPAYVHAWTQTDRLALAQNFQENGFDFFHPSTYNLLTKDGITQVDFPIHDYLVACISSFLKVEIIPTFRWYVLIYSLIGLFFLYLTLLLYTKSPVRSVLGTSFVFTLPFLVYYENGFLASAPSFSNFLIGIYFLGLARSTQQKKSYYLGILFLTLAALSRAPFFIFLFALVLQQLWQAFQQKKFSYFHLGIPLMGIGLFIGYYFYNQHLAATYGSMFLSEPLYFKSFASLINVVSTAIDRWGNELMSPYHAILFIALLAALSYQLYQKNFNSKLLTSFNHYFLISATGVLLFFIAFGQQFADHDYYYIDSFLPLVVMLLIIGLSTVKISSRWYTLVGTICGIFFFYFFSYSKQIQENRYSPRFDDRVAYAYNIYKSSKGDLIRWGVQPQDTLYVIEANSTNMPFTIWKNRGYTNLNSSAKYLAPELDSAYTYAVLVDSFFRATTFKDYPEIITKLQRIQGNGELSLYKKQKKGSPAPFFENLIYYGSSDFDDNKNLPESATQWIPLVKQEKNGNALSIKKEHLFSMTVKVIPVRLIPEKPVHILFRADYLQSDTSRFQIVSTFNGYYATHYTVSELDSIGEWERKLFTYRIDPKYFDKGKEIGFYFWNPDKTEITIDNVELLMYQ